MSTSNASPPRTPTGGSPSKQSTDAPRRVLVHTSPKRDTRAHRALEFSSSSSSSSSSSTTAVHAVTSLSNTVDHLTLGLQHLCEFIVQAVLAVVLPPGETALRADPIRDRAWFDFYVDMAPLRIMVDQRLSKSGRIIILPGTPMCDSVMAPPPPPPASQSSSRARQPSTPRR